MEIILSKQCKSLTGSLGRGYGYFIQRRRDHKGNVSFHSQRSKHPPVPRDGHWNFIVKCAELAQMKLHIADIRVSGRELNDAYYEAGGTVPLIIDVNADYNAQMVLNINKDAL